MPFCTQCGHQNPEGSNFCAQCGTRLVKPGSPSTPVAPAHTSEHTLQGDTSQIPVVVEEQPPLTPVLSDADKDAVASLPAGHALLVVRRGPSAGARFLLDGQTHDAGRHPDSDIFLDDITVSRHHVKFTRTPEGTVVSDVGSLNGTYVNRTLIDGDVLLKPGDEVQIGKFRMVYFVGPHGLD